MSLSQQQNEAITQILKDFFNQFLLNVASNAYILKCKSLKGKEQIETFQGEMIQTLNQSTKERFAQTKSGIFSFITHQQTAKLTEVAFKNIFDKYFIPLSLQSQYKTKPNDMVLQMGLILITGNIKPIFQSSTVPALFIKQAKKDSIDSDFFLKYITPVIEQVPSVLHSQLLGTQIPVFPKQEYEQKKDERSNCNCKKFKEQLKIQQQLIKLLENKNKILQDSLNNYSSDTKSKIPVYGIKDGPVRSNNVTGNEFPSLPFNKAREDFNPGSKIEKIQSQLQSYKQSAQGQTKDSKYQHHSNNIQLPTKQSLGELNDIPQTQKTYSRDIFLENNIVPNQQHISNQNKEDNEYSKKSSLMSKRVIKEESKQTTESEEEESSQPTESDDEDTSQEEFEVGSGNEEEFDKLDFNQGVFQI